MRKLVIGMALASSALATPALARQSYEDVILTLLPGETASYHRCAHSSKPHPGGGPPGSEQPGFWFDCRRDPQGMYEEYTAPPAEVEPR